MQKAVEGKWWCLSKNEGVSIDNTNIHCILHCLSLAWPILIYNLLGDVVNINCVISQDLDFNATLFNMLCNEM